MEKIYDVTPEMISHMKEGQTFKNFSELSKELNVLDARGKPLAGDSKKQFLENLARFTVLKTDGRKIIIEKIRPEDEILPSLSVKGNRKYVDMIQRLLVYHFNALCEATQCDGIKILWEKKDVWQACGMINDRYRWHGKTSDTSADAAFSDAFRKLAGGVKLKTWLDSALYGLAKHYALVYHERFAFVSYENGGTKIVPLTDEQTVTYLRLRTETLRNYVLSDGVTPAAESDLFASGRLNDFYGNLNPKLQKAFGFGEGDRSIVIQKVYEIIVEPKTMELFTKRFGKIDPQDTGLAIEIMSKLNSVVCDGLMSAISLDREVAVATRVREHKDVVNRLESQKVWGEIPLTKNEKEKRREFRYDHVQLDKEKKCQMVNKTIRLSEYEIRRQLQKGSLDEPDLHGCFILEKLYIDGFLNGSGLTEKQYERIVENSGEDIVYQ